MDRLSRDAAAAKAAGMSYGKWKAMQLPDVVVQKKPKKLIEKTCQFCGKTFFQSDNRVRKYCSPECKYEVDRQKQLEYNETHREEKREYNRAYLEKRRELISELSKV